MSQKSLRSIVTALSLILLTAACAISATKVYELGFKNNFNTGSVDIKLEQLCVDDDKIRNAEPRAVLPGEHLSYIPMVENNRADAYVRVKVDIVMDQDTDTPVTSDDIYMDASRDLAEDDVFQTADSSSWIQKGDYFYNTKVM